MSTTSDKRKQDNLKEEVEITEEMRALLAKFTQEEIDTGAVHTSDPPSARGTHTLQDLRNAYQAARVEDTIGAMLRALREQHHHTLNDAAKVLGVSRARIHQLEQPDANLRIDTLMRYARAYGYKVQVALVSTDASQRSIIAELPEETTAHAN